MGEQNRGGGADHERPVREADAAKIQVRGDRGDRVEPIRPRGASRRTVRVQRFVREARRAARAAGPRSRARRRRVEVPRAVAPGRGERVPARVDAVAERAGARRLRRRLGRVATEQPALDAEPGSASGGGTRESRASSVQERREPGRRGEPILGGAEDEDVADGGEDRGQRVRARQRRARRQVQIDAPSSSYFLSFILFA